MTTDMTISFSECARTIDPIGTSLHVRKAVAESWISLWKGWETYTAMGGVGSAIIEGASGGSGV